MPNNLTQVAGSYVGTMEEDTETRPTRSEPVIHITDHQTDVILDTISDFWDDTHLKQLNGVETFDFTTFSDESYSEHLADRNRIVIPGEDGEFLEFIIEEVIQHSDRTKAVYASASYLELKKQKVIEPQTLSGQTPQSAVDFALSNTEWRPGIITFTNIRTIHIEKHTNPYNLLRKIASEFDLELRFRVEIEHHRITGRYVDLIERVGEWRGREVVFGTDLLGVERKERTDQIVTALIGLGPEREDGTRLEVFVEDLDALQRWGRGGRHLIEVYEPESTDQDMTESRLRELTENELEKRVNAIVEYEVNIADVENVPGLENEQIRFGDTIRIKDEKFSPPLYLEARVHTQERSIKDKSRKKVILGDYVEYTEEDIRAIWKSLQAEIAKKVSMSQVMEVTYDKETIDQKDQTIENNARDYTDTETIPGKQAKQKIDEDVGSGTIETLEGAQAKADAAQQNAQSYTEQYAVMLDQLYDGTKISSTGGFTSERDDGLVRVTGNASVGFLIERRASTKDSWDPAFYVDSNGNVFFAGQLLGASGTFSGDVVSGRFISEVDGRIIDIQGDSVISEYTDETGARYRSRYTSGYLYFEYYPPETPLNPESTITIEGKQIHGNFRSGEAWRLDLEGLTLLGNMKIQSDDEWIAATLMNGWQNYGGNFAPAGYYKDALGFVHLRGGIRNGSIPNTAFQLPAGFRPHYSQAYAQYSASDTLARIDVVTSGNVNINSGNNAFVSLEGISFWAGWD